MRPAIRLRVRCLGLVLVCTAIGAPGGMATARAAAGATCAAWPGEPEPLPRTDDADVSRARWAALRVAELAREAGLAEETASSESQRLWRRVLCLDPQHAGAIEGVQRTRAVRVHRPALAWGRPETPRASRPWQGLDAPVRIARIPAPPPEATPPGLARGGELLAQARESLRSARFEEALGRAFAAREVLSAADTGAAHPEQRATLVELEVVSATAQLALGDEDGARSSLARALELEPALALDPGSTSPKVRAALDQARAARSAP